MTQISREMRARFAREADAKRRACVEITPAMIERAARGIAGEHFPIVDDAVWARCAEDFKQAHRDIARRALTAALSGPADHAGTGAVGDALDHYCPECGVDYPNHTYPCQSKGTNGDQT